MIERSCRRDKDGNVFLLGVGAQKAGTTWLYHYLRTAPGTFLDDTKEWHHWDALHLPEAKHFDLRERRADYIPEALDLFRRATGRQRKHFFLSRDFQRNPERYFDYFAAQLDRSDVHLTGDLTPSYAGLPHHVLAQIRDGFAARGIAVKVIFLMRDPVSRCLSAARMYRRLGRNIEGYDARLPETMALDAFLTSPDAALRTRYDRTDRRLRSVFADDMLYVGLYETMFREEELRRLGDFCNVPFRPEFVKHRFNASVPSQGSAQELTGLDRTPFSMVYAYCRDAYPETRHVWT
ncbi:hypothetical protein GCM10007385_41360 [Tateyamaria omphalii]|uniref:sulfotransferase n=1 Tax=Tateyamaria omphalii TaxID=299262 RepID=UPI0016774B40|nr:sulfotransferase [Tateyamaria omphalii]GGX67876.1 hypothetical protein GCM10007385_41360 [Tateyamaria omphalii]